MIERNSTRRIDRMMLVGFIRIIERMERKLRCMYVCVYVCMYVCIYAC